MYSFKALLISVALIVLFKFDKRCFITIHFKLFSTFFVNPLSHVCSEVCCLISKYFGFSRYLMVADFYLTLSSLKSTLFNFKPSNFGQRLYYNVDALAFIGICFKSQDMELYNSLGDCCIYMRRICILLLLSVLSYNVKSL